MQEFPTPVMTTVRVVSDEVKWSVRYFEVASNADAVLISAV